MRDHTNPQGGGGRLAILGLGIAALCLALAGSAHGQGKPKLKKQTDAEITQLLPGKWLLQTTLKELEPKYDPKYGKMADVKIIVTLHCKKDGTFKTVNMGEVMADTGKIIFKDTYEGTWKVTEGILEKTLTKLDAPLSPRLKVGDKGREILAINKTTLTLRSIDEIDAPTFTLKRVKD